MSPRPRFHNLEPDTRRRLLEVAAEEFAAHGFEGASLNRIIERSGMSKGAIYYYFDDKADLFLTVLHQSMTVLEPVRDALSTMSWTAEDFWSVCLEHYRHALHLAFEQPSAVGVLRAAADLRPQLESQGPLASLYRATRRYLSDLIERGQSAGAIRTDVPTDLLLDVVMAAGESAELWLLSHWEDLPDDRRERAVEWVFSMIRRVAQAGDD